jgi:hypothetical protein
VKPSQRRTPLEARAASAAALALLLAACSTDTTTAAAPSGPPSLEIAALISAGGARVDHPGSGQCVELGRDPSETITVLLGRTDALRQLVNWQFQPPFGCVGTPQCGFALVSLDPGAAGPALQIAGVGISIPIPMKDVAQAEGQHVLRVELRDSDGTMPANTRGRIVEITIDVERTCGRDGGRPPLGDASRADAHVPAVDASQAPPVDASSPDGSLLDSGTPRVRLPDASLRDAGPGSPADATTDSAASPDAAPRDAGARG